MTRPVVSQVTEELYADLEPGGFTSSDATYAWALLHFCEALVGVTLQDVADIVRDTDDDPGWSSVLDLDRTPTEALPWTAQFVGVTLLSGDSDAASRVRIANTGGWLRGSVGSIAAAIKPLLTGTQSVLIRERTDGTAGVDMPYDMTVTTLISETPDAPAVVAMLNNEYVKPAGIRMHHATVTGQDFLDLDTSYASFNAVDTAYTSFDDLLEN